MKLRPLIRSLRLSGWPRSAIAHLLRSNHREWSPLWIRQVIGDEPNYTRSLKGSGVR